MAMRWRLNVLTMSDDEALSMGVNAPRVRAVAVLFSALVTAASVAVSGLIGWVGLVVPHLTRGLVGSDYRHLLPASMLAGRYVSAGVDDHRAPRAHGGDPHRHPHVRGGRTVFPVAHREEGARLMRARRTWRPGPAAAERGARLT